MKYIVGLKYTNPAHEHVSLRRRVESRNTVVEAANEQEAILRASRQQRALGFMVQDAGIVQPQINESVESVDEAKGYYVMHSKGQSLGYYKNKQEAEKHAERHNMRGGSIAKVVADTREEVEQIDEGSTKPARPGFDANKHAMELMNHETWYKNHYSYGIRAAQKKLDKGNFDHEKNEKAGANLSKLGDYHLKTKLNAEEHRQVGKVIAKHIVDDIGAHSVKESVDEAKGEPPPEFMPSDTKLPRIKVPPKPKGLKYKTPPRTELKGWVGPAIRKEEVDQVEEAKKPLKPTYWRAEWRLGTQSEVDKNNKKIYDKLAKTDPAKAQAFHDNLLKIRKEEVEQVNETRPGWMLKHPDGAKLAAGLKAKKALEKKRQKAYGNPSAGVSVKEETMKPYVKAAQAKFDAQAKAQQVKKVQAGTLAAQRQRELARKTDEASDPGKTRVVNKKVKTEKAAATMIANAKGMRNKINMQPSLDAEGQKKV